MKHVTKEIFLDSLVCPRLGWLKRTGKYSITPSLGDQFRIEQGIRIGKKAHDLYPGGQLVDEMNILSASKKTKDLINDPSVATIFEATFLKDNYVAKADILTWKINGWHLIEVKSNITNKKEFVDDMAYTAMVIEYSGFDLSTISLLLLSKNFLLGMEKEKLFEKIDANNEVKSKIGEFLPFWEPIESLTKSSKTPKFKLIYECRKCDIFDDCVGKKVKDHIFELPRLSEPKFNQLTRLGINVIVNIPNDFPLTDKQKIIWECTRLQKPYIGNELKEELKSITWPAFYLDFETVMTAIPLYKDIPPYTKLPTQFSIHKCSEPGCIIDHKEYIADPKIDCRRELANKLIEGLESEGSIIVYSGFEKSIIKKLASAYPELSIKLVKLLDRLVDLEAIIRNNFHHPDFHGSTSIKKTLPALVNDLSYNDLAISNGDTAMAVFGFMALGKYDETELKQMQTKLLNYCKQDTLATVKLHEKLMGYV